MSSTETLTAISLLWIVLASVLIHGIIGTISFLRGKLKYAMDMGRHIRLDIRL